MGQKDGRARGPAIWRWGFIVGGSAGVLGIISAVATLALETRVSLLLDVVFVVLVLAMYFVGGVFVARQTGSIGAATLSGVVAGVFSAILREIAAVFVAYSQPLPALSTTGLDEGTLRTVLILIGVVFVLFLFGGLGAGLAALGGLAGRTRASYPYPLPYPGMPGYPPPGFAPPGFAPPGFVPPGFVPPGYPLPQGAVPPGYMPSPYAPPPGYPMPQGFGPAPAFGPPAYPPMPGYQMPQGYPSSAWPPSAPEGPPTSPPPSPAAVHTGSVPVEAQPMQPVQSVDTQVETPDYPPPPPPQD